MRRKRERCCGDTNVAWEFDGQIRRAIWGQELAGCEASPLAWGGGRRQYIERAFRTNRLSDRQRLGVATVTQMIHAGCGSVTHGDAIAPSATEHSTPPLLNPQRADSAPIFDLPAIRPPSFAARRHRHGPHAPNAAQSAAVCRSVPNVLFLPPYAGPSLASTAGAAVLPHAAFGDPQAITPCLVLDYASRRRLDAGSACGQVICLTPGYSPFRCFAFLF